ncbi:hypothetical protein PHYPSEUDO_005657 [Phytophthora pseudosyringae]|uniref:RxLR effector protein n=1 Tax=Phytophthora pseudosyringae TaxID=221518 RepID=A0A8T1VKG3_9STRA|nr:hypothetical protein PHYPSEUDO_005657 [Phytophthora pseudosyringae]
MSHSPIGGRFRRGYLRQTETQPFPDLSLEFASSEHKLCDSMRLSYVVLATVVALAASTEAVATADIEGHRFLRVHKHANAAATEERGLPMAARIKEKIFKLQMKMAMPGIKKILEGVLKDLFK